MPYARRSIRRRSSRRRRTSWYNKKYSTAQIARAAWRSAKYIRGLVNSELFHTDQTCALGANQSAIFSLCQIAQGDAINGRTGNSILVKSLAFNGYAYVDPTITNNTRFTLALVRDKQQISDTTPALTDIFTSGTDPHTLLNTNTTGRFKIMWRKQYTLMPPAGGRDSITFKHYDKLNFHVRFNGTANTDIQKNGLYLVMISSEPSKYPSISINTRLSYHDN